MQIVGPCDQGLRKFYLPGTMKLPLSFAVLYASLAAAARFNNWDDVREELAKIHGGALEGDSTGTGTLPFNLEIERCGCTPPAPRSSPLVYGSFSNGLPQRVLNGKNRRKKRSQKQQVPDESKQGDYLTLSLTGINFAGLSENRSSQRSRSIKRKREDQSQEQNLPNESGHYGYTALLHNNVLFPNNSIGNELPRRYLKVKRRHAEMLLKQKVPDECEPCEYITLSLNESPFQFNNFDESLETRPPLRSLNAKRKREDEPQEQNKRGRFGPATSVFSDTGSLLPTLPATEHQLCFSQQSVLTGLQAGFEIAPDVPSHIAGSITSTTTATQNFLGVSKEGQAIFEETQWFGEKNAEGKQIAKDAPVRRKSTLAEQRKEIRERERQRKLFGLRKQDDAKNGKLKAEQIKASANHIATIPGLSNEQRLMELFPMFKSIFEAQGISIEGCIAHQEDFECAIATLELLGIETYMFRGVLAQVNPLKQPLSTIAPIPRGLFTTRTAWPGQHGKDDMARDCGISPTRTMKLSLSFIAFYASFVAASWSSERDEFSKKFDESFNSRVSQIRSRVMQEVGAARDANSGRMNSSFDPFAGNDFLGGFGASEDITPLQSLNGKRKRESEPQEPNKKGRLDSAFAGFDDDFFKRDIGSSLKIPSAPRDTMKPTDLHSGFRATSRMASEVSGSPAMAGSSGMAGFYETTGPSGMAGFSGMSGSSGTAKSATPTTWPSISTDTTPWRSTTTSSLTNPTTWPPISTDTTPWRSTTTSSLTNPTTWPSISTDTTPWRSTTTSSLTNPTTWPPISTDTTPWRSTTTSSLTNPTPWKSTITPTQWGSEPATNTSVNTASNISWRSAPTTAVSNPLASKTNQRVNEEAKIAEEVRQKKIELAKEEQIRQTKAEEAGRKQAALAEQQKVSEENERQRRVAEENEIQRIVTEENERQQKRIKENERQRRMTEENERQRRMAEENERQRRVADENERQQKMIKENERQRKIVEQQKTAKRQKQIDAENEKKSLQAFQKEQASDELPEGVDEDEQQEEVSAIENYIATSAGQSNEQRLSTAIAMIQPLLEAQGISIEDCLTNPSSRENAIAILHKFGIPIPEFQHI
ncbi:Myosin light chain kinase [Paramicrosporidium saccamoebae]|uniref:Myosin light chain kinase n=1 Tax=Paramicrosporidium saccamoebae TaxID=1246581 RepID=A0A2H9TLE4_9FUNG|nr:Myosin light chain kinase [Paramicrosporidium saccamoebae]